MTWAERAAERSPGVPRSRANRADRGEQASATAAAIVEAAERLAAVKGNRFTTQELAKEAGIALQTFYRHFESKDHLLLAVLEDIVERSCQAYRSAGAELTDPVERLRSYVTSVVAQLDDSGGNLVTARFVTTEHRRLQALHPLEMAHVNRPFTDLLRGDIDAAVAAGQARTTDAGYTAWLLTELVSAVFHHYAFAVDGQPLEEMASRLWAFCLRGLGGTC